MRSCGADSGGFPEDDGNLAVRPFSLERFFFSLLLLSRLFLLCAASPADVEVDLVFPKANETYKLIWPFPIIYAIRNAFQLWQENYEVARFSVSWQVSGFPYQESIWTGQKHLHAGSGFWSPLTELGTNHYEDQTVRPDDGVHMRFETLNTNIINGTERMFRLDYNITWTNYGERCMKMTPTRQSDPCGLKLDAEDLANRTQAAMLEFAACSKGTWPDPEGRLGPRFCNAESSSSARDFSGKVLVLSVLLGIIVMYSM
ncbi:hypothetical protein CPLU01_14471 [Colletotrichum plurivorum]|uniref:DUF7136 domain-containing protein n=1 Tax=Colletotrichum plurivorum TaxID=2175906 RepID=A0A8H6MYV9_9PEZI|nr:hypothetical protein CPLU01_14471 [Colletotrichum plurivorum]